MTYIENILSTKILSLSDKCIECTINQINNSVETESLMQVF